MLLPAQTGASFLSRLWCTRTGSFHSRAQQALLEVVRACRAASETGAGALLLLLSLGECHAEVVTWYMWPWRRWGLGLIDAAAAQSANRSAAGCPLGCMGTSTG